MRLIVGVRFGTNYCLHVTRFLGSFRDLQRSTANNWLLLMGPALRDT